jgi:hypothetical protein
MTADDQQPPRPGLRLGWIAFALLAAALVVSGAMILAGRSSEPVAGHPTAAPMIGGGGTVSPPPTVGQKPSAPSTSVTFPPVSPRAPSRTRPGEAIDIAGVGTDRTITCDDNAVRVSGVNNTVVLHGHCTRVDVSGVDNAVTIDAVDAIVVSGIRNAVTFGSGDPQLSKSGVDNTLERR